MILRDTFLPIQNVQAFRLESTLIKTAKYLYICIYLTPAVNMATAKRQHDITN